MKLKMPNYLWIAGAAVIAASSASRKTYTGYSPGYYQTPYYGGNGGYGGFGGYGWGGMGGIGSTPMGSYLGGMSTVIRAQGQANLSNSQAAINLEQAAKLNTENQVQWTNAYIEMRRMKKAWADENKPPPTPPETWARLAQAGAPSDCQPTPSIPSPAPSVGRRC